MTTLLLSVLLLAGSLPSQEKAPVVEVEKTSFLADMGRAIQEDCCVDDGEETVADVAAYLHSRLEDVEAKYGYLKLMDFSWLVWKDPLERKDLFYKFQVSFNAEIKDDDVVVKVTTTVLVYPSLERARLGPTEAAGRSSKSFYTTAARATRT